MKRLVLGLLVLFQMQGYTVVLDPGHGGPYTGTVSASGNVVEKEMVLTLSLQLAQKLREKGINVVLTRTDDTVLDSSDLMNDLKKRAQMSTDHNADLFLSIHLNASANPSIHGYEVYVPYENKYPIKSYQLASAIHYELTQKIAPCFYGGNMGNLNAIDRGIRASRFNVIKRATCPAVLVELAYLSHKPSAEEVASKEYQELLVNTLYSGIRRYMIHSKKE